jgi:hypothetical protein
MIIAAVRTAGTQSRGGAGRGGLGGERSGVAVSEWDQFRRQQVTLLPLLPLPSLLAQDEWARGPQRGPQRERERAHERSRPTAAQRRSLTHSRLRPCLRAAPGPQRPHPPLVPRREGRLAGLHGAGDARGDVRPRPAVVPSFPHETHNTLSRSLPSTPDAAKKRAIVDYVLQTRRQVLKLLVLVRWSSEAGNVAKCMVSSSLPP